MKKTLAVLVAVVLVLQSTWVCASAAGTGKGEADALYSLGLVKGISSEVVDHGLGQTLTRAEAIVMVVRFLGAEAEAASAQGTKAPFDDVPDWAETFVDYAYGIGFTNGKLTDEGTPYFGSEEAVMESEFLTFMLRVLGYDDSRGDFAWDSPYDLAQKVGIYLPSEGAFLRGNAIQVCYAMLEAKKVGASSTLAEEFIAGGLFTANEYAYAKKLGRIRWNAPENMRVALVSDIHYLQGDDSPLTMGTKDEDRMRVLVESLNEENRKKPIDFCIFDGDLITIHGDKIGEKVENLQRLVDNYLSRLDMPWFAIRGNHDCYSDEDWYTVMGNPPQLSLEADNYIFMLVDAYGDYENGQLYNGADLAYSGVDAQIDWVNRQITYAKAADKYIFAVYHYFNAGKDPLWLDILKNDNIVAGQVRGHSHVVAKGTEYGKVLIGCGNFGAVPQNKDKTYSYSNGFGFKMLEQQGETLVVYHVYPAMDYPAWKVYHPETDGYTTEPYTQEYVSTEPSKIKLPTK